MARLKIAFVGTGGAARGLAHLGVLKACEELGIAPEIFVGASAGALVGATYGQDVPLDVLLDGYRLPWRRRHTGPRLHMSAFLGLPGLRDLIDPGYLLSGMFSIDKLERYLARHLPINDFRRLPRSVFVTAVDIDNGKRAVFGPGYEESVPLSQAVAASCCVPVRSRRGFLKHGCGAPRHAPTLILRGARPGSRKHSASSLATAEPTGRPSRSRSPLPTGRWRLRAVCARG